MPDTAYACSFCGAAHDESNKLIAGPGVFICDECVGKCVDILDRPETHGTPQMPFWDSQTDEEILRSLPRIAQAGEQVDAGLRARITRLRDHGVSWAKIGAALSMTRQSAWERFSGED